MSGMPLWLAFPVAFVFGYLCGSIPFGVILTRFAGAPDVRGIEMREISTLVNNVRNNGPELLEPAVPQPEQVRLL